jgi:hypothetical protein
VDTLLQTNTGRRLASEFVAEGAHADLVMGSFAGSRTAVEDGKRVLQATAGKTATDRDPPRVMINKDFLDTDPEYRRASLAGTVAHELFGHALESQRVRKEGVPLAAQYFYRGDELGSEMIDWTIQTELNGKVADGDPAPFLSDPEGYYRSLWTADSYYAVTLSPAEMKNPLAALKVRRRAVADEREKTRDGVKEMAAWRPVIRHFIQVHKIPRARLTPATAQVDDYMNWASAHTSKLDEIKTYLDAKIEEWSGPRGAKETAQLAASADSPYLANAEARLAARAVELRRLMTAAEAARAPVEKTEIVIDDVAVAAPAGPPAKIDLDELQRLLAADQTEHPEHW